MVMKRRQNKRPMMKRKPNRKMVQKCKFYKSAKDSNIHRFARFTESSPITLNGTGADVAQSFQFNLSQVQNYTQFTSLFDFYRLDRCELTFKLRYDNSNTSISTGQYPTMYYYRDHDDNNTPTLADMRLRATTKILDIRPGKLYKFNIKPSVLSEIYRIGGTHGYVPKYSQWIDTSQPDVQHFGFKDVITGLQSGQTLEVNLKTYFSCKAQI